ncbi:MAG TPA: YfhO family protein [Candidatus Sulfomarinibacteraceae bacterium]|nr:YfhO family protein [Candidatus Sulfomarinibacteraceae bacterium]
MRVEVGRQSGIESRTEAGPLRPVARYAPLLVLAILLALFFGALLFSNRILARGDTFLYFYPYWEAAAAALRAGRAPLWNPSLFMGAPFLANSQVGFFYPLNWPLWWLLETPFAASASIFLHLLVAAGGAYALARRALDLSRSGAWAAALLFAAGGYVTAQVEHINQLQGMAWLPWLLLTADWTLAGDNRRRLRGSLLLAALFALQLLAGHTQSVFISGLGVLIWLLLRAPSRLRRGGTSLLKQAVDLVWPLVLGALLALALAAVQLAPTLALMAQSSRQGGLPLNEALSFSLHPLLLGQSLLPHLGQSLFTEYVAFAPLTAYLLAAVGAWGWRRQPRVLAPLGLAIGGFLLALGRFNPLYILLASMPGFNLFRAPARWLLLYALGVALLAAVGWDVLRRRMQAEGGQGSGATRALRAGLLLVMALIIWHFLAVPLGEYIAVGPEAPLELPAPGTVLLWAAELALAYMLLFRAQLWRALARRGLWPVLAGGVLVGSLFIASRPLPYAQPTAPAAYFDLRPPQARLLALNNCELLPQQCRQPPGRLLSLSNIFFDLGDQVEIETIYGGQLTAQALHDYVVATKQKEIVAPNLPLATGLASVDGFDGGILPLRNYTLLVRLLLPEGVEASDGRLREYLTDVPEARWLDLFNTRYVITDKVRDEWRRDVFFDMTHAVDVAPGDRAQVGHVPAFEGTALWLVAGGATGTVLMETMDGERWELTPEPLESELWRAELPQPAVAQNIELVATDAVWRVQGLALVDERDGAFHALAPGAYRLLYSGDVKIYENLDVLPRAFMVHRWQWQPDVASSVAAMSAPDFDPGQEAVVVGTGEEVGVEGSQGEARIVRYEAERVEIETESVSEGLLVLTDAHYLGWRATLDGEEVAIQQVDGLFRGVFVPPGSHRIIFTFISRPFEVGRLLSLLALAGWAVALVVIGRRRL